MAAKLQNQEGRPVVVLTGKDKGKSGDVLPLCRRKTARSSPASTWSAPPASDPTRKAASSKEAPIHLSNLAIARPEGRQADPRRFQTHEMAKGPRRQAFRRSDRWLISTTPRLKKHYEDVVRQADAKQFGYANPMQVPRIDKIVLNMGVGEAVATPRSQAIAPKIWPASPARSPSSPRPAIRLPASSCVKACRSAPRSPCARHACTSSWTV
jgi:ribosomal protein L24